MSQVRIYNFGDTLTSTKIATVNQVLYEPGIYAGYDITIVDAQTIQLAQGFVLLSDGILLTETTDIQLAFDLLPVFPTIYTIYVTHIDSAQIGGSGAFYLKKDGYFTSIADAVVLGWIFHPGKATPLAPWMVFQPGLEKTPDQIQYQKDLENTYFLAPFSGSSLAFTQNAQLFGYIASDILPFQAGTNITQLRVVASSTLIDIPNNIATRANLFFSIKTKLYAPAMLVIRAALALGVVMKVALFDTNGTQVLLEGDAFVTDTPDEYEEYKTFVPIARFDTAQLPNIYVKNGVWEPEKLWQLQVTFELPPGGNTPATGKVARMVDIDISYNPIDSVD